ncbi:MAG: hypothetical protein IPF56_21540 [Chloroflexi bacterium]|nr:hypothetical protein [Chloroflexota bacterium]
MLDLGLPLRVTSLADRPEMAEKARVLFPGMHYETGNGSRVEFVRLAATACLRERPDILLVGHPPFAGLSQILARLSGAKAVDFVYGIDVWEPLSWTRRRGLRAATRHCYQPVHHGKAQRVNGVMPEKGRILYNCLDPEFQGALAAKVTAPRLLTVGRMSLAEQYKGMTT